MIEKHKKYLLLIIITILIILSIKVIINSLAQKEFDNSPGVLATTVKQTHWQPLYQTIGNFAAIENIAITARTMGRITQVNFHSGDKVRAGQILVQLEAESIKAELQQKQNNLAIAKISYQRMQKLVSKNIIAKAEYDKAELAYKNAIAQVADLQSKLNYQTIKAPVDGILGITNVSVGSLLKPGDLITQLQHLQPIYLDFSLPQEYVSRTLIGQNITAKLTLDRQIKSYTGEIVSLDSQLDPITRTIKARAQFDNPICEILPGMFAEIAMPVGAEQIVSIVPADAILNTLYGTFVFTIECHLADQCQVQQVPISLVNKVADQVIVRGKISIGQSIVKMGAFKLRNGGAVKIIPELALNKAA